MKTIVQLITAVSCAMLFTGCMLTGNTRPVEEPVEKRPLRLTTEEILTDSLGSAIIVYFPKGAGKPGVAFNQETGQWYVGADVPESNDDTNP